MSHDKSIQHWLRDFKKSTRASDLKSAKNLLNTLSQRAAGAGKSVTEYYKDQYLHTAFDVMPYTLICQHESSGSISKRSEETQLQMIELLDHLKHIGFNVDEPEPDGFTVLMYAIRDGLDLVFDWLLKQPEIQIHRVEKEGWSALHMAAHHGRVDMAKILIQKGMDIQLNTTDIHQQDSLQVALENHQSKVVDLLLESGWQCKKNKVEARQLINAAILDTHLTLVKHLLQSSVEINKPILVKTSSFGDVSRFPLVLAVEEENMEAIKLLMEHGAQDTVEVTVGSTKKQSVYDYVQNLIEVGAVSPDLKEIGAYLKQARLIEHERAVLGEVTLTAITDPKNSGSPTREIIKNNRI